MSECPLGYFGDTAARRCRRCHKGCETCLGRSPTQCLSCRRGFFHYQETNTCVTLCPVGLYADESKWTVHRHRMSEFSTSRYPACAPGVCSPILGGFAGPLASCTLLVLSGTFHQAGGWERASTAFRGCSMLHTWLKHC